MKTVRLILALFVCIPLGAVFGVAMNSDGTERQQSIGLAAGALIGLVFGLMFGGVERVTDFVYGPKQPDADDDELNIRLPD